MQAREVAGQPGESYVEFPNGERPPAGSDFRTEKSDFTPITCLLSLSWLFVCYIYMVFWTSLRACFSALVSTIAGELVFPTGAGGRLVCFPAIGAFASVCAVIERVCMSVLTLAPPTSTRTVCYMEWKWSFRGSSIGSFLDNSTDELEGALAHKM